MTWLLAASDNLGALATAIGALAAAIVAFGRWLMVRLDKRDDRYDLVVDQMLTQVIPAVQASTLATKQVMELLERQQRELNAEREARIRLEERRKDRP